MKLTSVVFVYSMYAKDIYLQSLFLFVLINPKTNSKYINKQFDDIPVWRLGPMKIYLPSSK